MRNIIVMLCMMFGSTFAAKASGGKVAKTTEKKPKTALSGEEAKLCSNKMITGLQLNNYQSRKVHEINVQLANKITQLEKQYAANPAELAKKVQELNAERDRVLENVLSTVQYNDYFGHRSDYKVLDEQQLAAADTPEQENNRPEGTAAVN